MKHIFSHRVVMSVSRYVCAIGCSFFGGPFIGPIDHESKSLSPVQVHTIPYQYHNSSKVLTGT